MKLHWLALATFAIPATAQTLEESYQLLPIQLDGGGGFGRAVAATRLRLIVGAPDDDAAGALAGAAQVFDAPSGRLLHTLLPEKGSVGARFGRAVALDARRALVGAPGDASHGPHSGAASAHDLASGQRLFRFAPKDGLPGDELGCAVALGDGYAVIGARGRGGTGACFVLDATSGELRHLLGPDASKPWAEFGGAVAISGGLVVVGCPGDDERGEDVGAAYVFDAASGERLRKLLPAYGRAGDRFGCAVSIDGGRVLVGANRDDEVGEEAGAAYLFDVRSGAQLAKLFAGAARPEDRFGESVALSGELAIVGLPGADDDCEASGAVCVFDARTGRELERLTPAAGGAQLQFGSAVALQGQTAVVGVGQGSGAQGGGGAAYLFELQPWQVTGEGSCYGDDPKSPCPCGLVGGAGEGCPNSTGRGARLSGTGDASLTNDSFELVAHGLPAGTPALILRGIDPVNGGHGLPLADGLLCVSGQTLTSPPQLTTTGGSATYARFQGGAFGSYSYGPGTRVIYQCWYRDPRNRCSGEGFNSTNAWSVVWQP